MYNYNHKIVPVECLKKLDGGAWEDKVWEPLRPKAMYSYSLILAQIASVWEDYRPIGRILLYSLRL